MSTPVFNQGYNRVEHHQIICLERAKLNRFLDEERRVIETLVRKVRQRIETAPQQFHADAQTIWNNIQNHSCMLAVQERISILTDAYPQFLSQVEAVRTQLKKRILNALEATRSVSQIYTACH